MKTSTLFFLSLYCLTASHIYGDTVFFTGADGDFIHNLSSWGNGNGPLPTSSADAPNHDFIIDGKSVKTENKSSLTTYGKSLVFQNEAIFNPQSTGAATCAFTIPGFTLNRSTIITQGGGNNSSKVTWNFQSPITFSDECVLIRNGAAGQTYNFNQPFYGDGVFAFQNTSSYSMAVNVKAAGSYSGILSCDIAGGGVTLNLDANPGPLTCLLIPATTDMATRSSSTCSGNFSVNAAAGALDGTRRVELKRGGSTLFLKGNQTIGTLAGSGGTLTASSESVMTVNQATDETFAVAMSGPLSLVKRGAAKLTISVNSNTATGSLAIEEGSLVAATGNTLFLGGTTVASGAELVLSAATISSRGPLTISGGTLSTTLSTSFTDTPLALGEATTLRMKAGTELSSNQALTLPSALEIIVDYTGVAFVPSTAPVVLITAPAITGLADGASAAIQNGKTNKKATGTVEIVDNEDGTQSLVFNQPQTPPEGEAWLVANNGNMNVAESWLPAIAIDAAEASDYDYIVNGLNVKTSESAAAFTAQCKSLTVQNGIFDIACYTDSNSAYSYTIPNLSIIDGTIRQTTRKSGITFETPIAFSGTCLVQRGTQNYTPTIIFGGGINGSGALTFSHSATGSSAGWNLSVTATGNYDGTVILTGSPTTKTFKLEAPLNGATWQINSGNTTFTAHADTLNDSPGLTLNNASATFANDGANTLTNFTFTAGTLSGSGTLTLDTADDLDLQGAQSGALSIVKRGGGNLIFSGEANRTGATLIESGNLMLTQAATLGDVTLAQGSELICPAATLALGNLTGEGTLVLPAIPAADSFSVGSLDLASLRFSTWPEIETSEIYTLLQFTGSAAAPALQNGENFWRLIVNQGNKSLWLSYPKGLLIKLY